MNTNIEASDLLDLVYGPTYMGVSCDGNVIGTPRKVDPEIVAHDASHAIVFRCCCTAQAQTCFDAVVLIQNERVVYEKETEPVRLEPGESAALEIRFHKPGI